MPDLRALASDLSRHTWSLTAIAIAAERGVLTAIAERPRTVAELASIASLALPTARALADVLAALELVVVEGDEVRDGGALAPYRDARAAEVLAADLRSTLGTNRDAAYAAEARGAIEGWRAIDPVAVRAQGIVSHAMTLSLAPLLRAMPDRRAGARRAHRDPRAAQRGDDADPGAPPLSGGRIRTPGRGARGRPRRPRARRAPRCPRGPRCAR